MMLEILALIPLLVVIGGVATIFTGLAGREGWEFVGIIGICAGIITGFVWLFQWGWLRLFGS